mmetsp:Transcript_3869/g.4365  ORF Transcript_3869/g.4365 Transcript_3869/m.4365 type:complete len:81 (-) Transcript_3869:3-245(-)
MLSLDIEMQQYGSILYMLTERGRKLIQNKDMVSNIWYHTTIRESRSPLYIYIYIMLAFHLPVCGTNRLSKTIKIPPIHPR